MMQVQKLHHMPISPARSTLDLHALVAARKPGHSLAAPFYTSREVFDLDLELIFGRHWINVGVEPDVPEPGDYVTVEIGSESILIVRDDDMQIRAFHNVCRHRGARLCNEHKGAVGNLVCPYHQWTYDLKGELISAEHMGAEFDRCKHGLKPVHLRNLAGLLFICLAEHPPADFEEMRWAMEPYLLPHQIANTKIAAQVDVIEQANWKLTMENNRECYHCRANHPELTISVYEYGFGYQPTDEHRAMLDAFKATIERNHEHWERDGLPSRELDHLNDKISGFRTVRLPLDRARESQTLDAKVACTKLLGDFQRTDLGGLSFWTQPNSWHHFMSDHIVTFSVLPLTPDTTLVRTKWLVHKDAVEGKDYNVDNLTAVWNATNDQDRTLVEQAQRGVRSQAYEPGPFSPYTEELVEKFCDWYTQRLRALMK